MKIATLAIITRGDQILLGLRKEGVQFGAGTLNGPGGKFDTEKDETLIDCVVRETKEEVAILLNKAETEEVAIITFFAGGIPDFEVHVYRTNNFVGEPRETESMIPYWFDIDKLPIDRMLESDREWFPRLIMGEKFKAKVFYRERAKGFIEIKFLPFID